ncbi:MAG TPA: hydantoinase/oxoprolinase family protein [Chloroflexia bacterium]|nr:hydantoinase/oxoprolinase family protein [Chloroflexia bacterium]
MPDHTALLRPPGDAAGALADDVDIPNSAGMRIGVDVGGTFTKAVAIYSNPLRIVHQVVVPTTHAAPQGVALGVVQALSRLLAAPTLCRFQPRVVAHSTTQAVNALLEGDTAVVGIIGMAHEEDRREAEKRTRVGDIALAPGRTLRTLHRFLDTTNGLLPRDVLAAVRALADAGAGAIVASEAFSVDDAAHERLVMSVARELGLPATGGHEVSGAYGLEVRTLTAAINASIMPRMLQTAELVEHCLREAGVQAPLVVMRGDGGVMSMQQLRERPLLTVLSGPAASLAGALLSERVLDGIFLEVGGTSTNLGVIRGGQPAMKYVQVMDHPTCLRSLDVRVQGVAGGSMARVRGKKLADVGPRSAHIAGLAYSCFARPEELDGPLALELFAPRDGDPADYIAVRNAAGQRFALTVTCAANALGRVAAGAYAYAPPEAARRAFAPLGQVLGCAAEAAAAQLLDRAASQVAAAVRALVTEYHLDRKDLTLIGGGGGAAALGPAVAAKVGAQWSLARHAEVISSIGVGMAMVREEAEKTLDPGNPDEVAQLAALVEERAIRSGADPASVHVYTEAVPEKGGVRAVAIGNVGLEASGTREIGADEALQIAARRVQAPAGKLLLIGQTAHYFACGPLPGRAWAWSKRFPAVIVDRHGSVRLEADEAEVLVGAPLDVLGRLRRILTGERSGAFGLGPRLYLLNGPHLLDLSALQQVTATLAAAEKALAGATAPTVLALVQRARLL